MTLDKIVDSEYSWIYLVPNDPVVSPAACNCLQTDSILGEVMQ